MATHSSVLAWRIPGTGEPGGRPSMGSHRVGHNWSDLAAAAATAVAWLKAGFFYVFSRVIIPNQGQQCLETFSVVIPGQRSGILLSTLQHTRRPPQQRTTPPPNQQCYSRNPAVKASISFCRTLSLINQFQIFCFWFYCTKPRGEKQRAVLLFHFSVNISSLSNITNLSVCNSSILLSGGRAC